MIWVRISSAASVASYNAIDSQMTAMYSKLDSMENIIVESMKSTIESLFLKIQVKKPLVVEHPGRYTISCQEPDPFVLVN